MIIIKANEKLTILYARLSQDDHNLGDSNSIINQKLILEKYAKDNGFKNTLFLSDDGYTGTNFDRPAFNEIIELIEQGKVSTLIVKDLSRFGRNYIVAGQYLEDYFPSHNINFIAMNDGVDSRDENSNDFTPMRNYFNEYYAKDCSKKCRASIKIKAATGARVGSRPPFGYKKDPKDPKKRIVIDEDTASIVKYIFSLCVSGMGPAVIANQLEAEEILNPSHYYFNKYGVKMQGYYTNKPYRWPCTTVSGILENEVYIGNTINLKTSTLSYKHKKKIQLPRESQFVFENTHEAIVDKEVWDIVQQIRKNKKRRPNMAEQNIFSGLVLCDTCGKTLTLNRSRSTGKEKNHFCCGTYRKNGNTACSKHRINERELYAIILDDLNRITYYARLNEKLFVDKIAAMNNKNLGKSIVSLENELEDYICRSKNLKSLLKKVYEDNALNKISDEVFYTLSEEYQVEETELKKLIAEKSEELQHSKSLIGNSSLFLEKAKKYTEITELSAEILNVFIEKVVVHEREAKVNGKSKQQIDIYYRDIGLINNSNKK